MDVMVFLQSPGGLYYYVPIRAKLSEVLLSWWYGSMVQQFVLGENIPAGSRPSYNFTDMTRP